jgi:hypothetical protein
LPGKEQRTMEQTCEIFAVSDLNLLLRGRWRFVAVSHGSVIASSEPFWSNPTQVVEGNREFLAHYALLKELAQQKWRPLKHDGATSSGDWYRTVLTQSSVAAPQLVEAQDHWLLPFEGCTIWEVRVGFDLRFVLCDDQQTYIRVAGLFTYNGADGQQWTLDPDGPKFALGPALAVHGLTVQRAVAHKSGRLSLAFTDGSTISVEPDHQYEAWESGGPWGYVVSTAGVMANGRGLAVWPG